MGLSRHRVQEALASLSQRDPYDTGTHRGRVDMIESVLDLENNLKRYYDALGENETLEEQPNGMAIR